MNLVIVPHTAGSDYAVLWLGVHSATPPDNLVITVSSVSCFKRILIRKNDWNDTTVGGLINSPVNRFFTRSIFLKDLPGNSRFTVKARNTRGEFKTLPEKLPALGERPLNLMLSSCFYYNNDKTGEAGRAFKSIPDIFKPDLKIMCGDQVYLDVADGHFLQLRPVRFDNPPQIAKNYLYKYINTWTQKIGFGSILAAGATYFTADDHEFWNNYPNPTPLILNTYDHGYRKTLKDISVNLYNVFQSYDAAATGHRRVIELGDISIFIADTRVFREEGDDRFMSDEDFDALLEWINGLSTPGVLVTGQPLFQKPSGYISKNLGDRAMANYGQYKELVRSLFSLKNSVVVLTGDVHYGRISSCILSYGELPVELVEIVSSPTSLVSSLVGGKAEDAPYSFPPEPISGIAGVKCMTHYKTARNNFATIHFNELNGQVRMQVRYWFPDGGDDTGSSVCTRILN